MTATLDQELVAPGVVSTPQDTMTPAPSLHEDRPAKRRASVPQLVSLMLVGLASWCLLFVYVLSPLQEARSQHELYAQFRYQLSQGLLPAGGPIAAGQPVALLNAPSVGVRDVVVVEGTDAATLRQGPGHLQDSPLPGQAGGVVLMGRSEAFGGPFAFIPSLRPGALITVTTVQGTFTYVMTDVRRPGQLIPRALASSVSSLTLVSSEGTGWRSGWAPSATVYADAVLKGSVTVPAPLGAPTSVANEDQALKGDFTQLASLVLLLQFLVLAVILTVVARHKWGRSQGWILGTPVIIAGLWLVSDSAFLLLPNIF